tara:strand:- start:6698 stop:7528 length:831 start_codon:yes stop_codon:yes gene_type:complete
MSLNEYLYIKEFAFEMRKNILKMALDAGASSSHFGGGLSIVEILSVLYCKYINNQKKNNQENQNRFILSKGHGVLPYYSALYQKGFLKNDDLKLFEKTGGKLFGHPVMNRDFGIEFSTGSLGIGIGLAVGLSLANKLKKRDNKVYVVIGDGECNEGSVWEAAMCASHHNLTNLTVILDNNGFQQTGSNNQISNSVNLASKWKSFGFEVINVDGHNINQLIEAFEKKTAFPKILIAKTIKGKGFSFSENNNEWHHKVLTSNTYNEALKELNESKNRQ